VALVLAAGCVVRPTPPPDPVWSPCTGPKCLRLLSWNVHAIPFVTAQPTRRVRNVAAKIREQQPDVVLLQEVWTHAYAAVLRRALAGDYRLTYAGGCRRPFPCGGLVVLVRVASGWVASPPTFVPFRAHAPWRRFREWDVIAKKGMLVLRLTRGDRVLGIVDTHLQSRYPEYRHNYMTVRRHQLEQLRATVDATFGGAPVVIGGDFNTAPNDPSGLYASHVAPLGDDASASFRAGCPGCGTRTPPKLPRWIDYVLTRGLAVTPAVTRILSTAIDTPYSDHHGVLVRLTCTRDDASCGM
jgi:endonuclease/exonuclease/phosphatase family metal-dependent hydrolase